MNLEARVLLAGIACSISATFHLGAVGLSPDDPAISDDLVLWLRDPGVNFDVNAGRWLDSSGKGNDAIGIGTVGTVEWAVPGLSTIAGGELTPLTLESVRFSGSANDMLAASGLNAGSGLSELTVISVYAVSDRNNLTRALGFGSVAATQANAGNHFNLAGDPSIRKDNGQIGSGSYSASIPISSLFVRTARMNGGGVDEWFNLDGTINKVLSGAGTSFTTSTDTFYLGDVRAGATSVPGFGGTSSADIDVVEVIVYKGALSDARIAGINEWLVENLGGEPAPRIHLYTATPVLIEPGESSLLEWDVEGADSVEVSPDVGEVTLMGSAGVAPQSTTTYTLTAIGAGGTTIREVTIGVGEDVESPVINEVVATNNNTLEDEDGDGSDWIEIRNPSAFTLDLGQYYLSDDPVNPTLWQIPAGTMVGPGEFLVIFASGKDRGVAGSELHTNFRLSSSGEDLRLYGPDGVTLISQLLFPAQIPDVAYGLDADGDPSYLVATPGAENGTGFDGKVEDTKFSVDRGFFENPQSVIISTATPGAEIRFTLDGSEPTATHGEVYTAPIVVSTTTTLRAAAFMPNMISTNVDTHSYLFLEDVIRQPANPAGAPASWGNRSADYEMDPDVVDDPVYRDEIIDALKSIRTLSIVVPNDEFFNNPRGIYANPQNDGRDWEREVSFEFLHPDDDVRNLQTNCGIRIHGNGSRSASGQPKHGFRVEFRGEYGSKSLNYSLFPDSEVDEFDSLILRAQNAHGWTRASQIANNVGTSEREQSQYIRDSFARDIMKGMGQTAGESTYVHLYINGLYWGLYNPVEYPRAAYGASHFGGAEADYDAINRRTTTTKILDGSFDAWNEMQALANSGLTTQEKYEEMETHINIDNLIDYMLMHQYMGSRDGPEVFNSNNMRAIRKSRGEEQTTWIGMPWDMEASMFEIDVTRNVNMDDPNTLVRVYNKLRENPEFRLRYADRVHRHCFNGGTLTPDRVAGIWEVRANEIYQAIIGESARWGDFRRANQPFTRNVEWQNERNRLLTSYFPTRSEFVVELLRNNGLYPETDAPVFGQHGGQVSNGFSLEISSDQGAIYYTTNGADPRLTGGAVSPDAGLISNGGGAIALNQSVLVRARAFFNGEWSALTEATFFVGNLASSENLIVSEIMYHPEDGASEFIELRNTSDETIDLSGVSFGSGVEFVIQTGTTIAPGEFFLITAFENDTALSNGGELITLLAVDGSVIESFRYRDEAPWPESPDGGGTSLTRILPPGPPGDPLSWRASVSDGGSPLALDSIAFAGDPHADLDQDGLNAFLEHSMGTSDSLADSGGNLFSIDLEGSLSFSIQQNLAADDVIRVIEYSSDLLTWEPVTTDLNFVGTTDLGDGKAKLVYTTTNVPDPLGFWRLRIELRE